MYEKKDIPSMNSEFYQKKEKPMQRIIIDESLEHGVAEKLTKLAALRGLKDVTVIWDAEKQQYIANGMLCGRSVDGVTEWFDKQEKSNG